MADEDFDEDTALHQRFKSLIQPIKDLAANWDVDIAESLNDYLDELSRLAFTVDESDDEGDENEMNVDDNQLRKKKTTKKLNFAEAALLIQGSTNIYSKKVEYLYQLVLKSLEVITHRKSTILRNSNEEEDEQGEGGDGAIVIGKINRNKNVNKLQELDLYDFTCDDPKYLLLDDYIEEGKNIDLPNKESILKQYDIPTTRSRLSLDRSLQNISHISNVSNASIALMTSFLQQDLGKNEFRLTTSFINADGSLFIPGMDPVNGHDHNNQSIILPSTTKKKNLNVSFHQEGEDNQKDGAVAMDVVANDDYFPVATDDDYGYSDRLSQEHYTSPLRDPAVDKQIENVPVTASDNIPPPSSSTANAIEKEDDAALDLENVNFPMHDPHEVLPGSKPFRKGKCYRTPKAPSLTQEEKFHLMMYGCLPDETPPTFKTVDDVDVTQILVSFDPQAPVMFTALQPLYELKLKLDKRRTRLEQLAARKASRQAGVQEGEDVENGGAEEEILHNLYETGNRSKNEVDLADIPPELQYIYAPAGDEDELGEMNGDDNPYIDNGGDAYFDGEERAGRDVNEPDNGLYFFDTNEEEELTKRVEAALEDSIVQTQGGGSSYQSMIKQYLEGFGASSYQRESQLVQRVNEWTTRIEPILAAQEEVKPFDIYEYSDEVLTTANHILLEKKKRKEKLKQENQDELYKEKQDEGHEEDIKFSEIVTGKSTSEICRLFLSCLQLANQGNLEIMTDQQDQSNSNNAVLTSLTQPLNTVEDKKTRRGQRNQKVSAATVMMTQDLTHLAAGAKPLPEGSVGNDLTFRLHSVQRSKDIEEFRAPSLVTHPIGRQQPRSKENIPI